MSRVLSLRTLASVKKTLEGSNCTKDSQPRHFEPGQHRGVPVRVDGTLRWVLNICLQAFTVNLTIFLGFQDSSSLLVVYGHSRWSSNHPQSYFVIATWKALACLILFLKVSPDFQTFRKSVSLRHMVQHYYLLVLPTIWLPSSHLPLGSKMPWDSCVGFSNLALTLTLATNEGLTRDGNLYGAILKRGVSSVSKVTRGNPCILKYRALQHYQSQRRILFWSV